MNEKPPSAKTELEGTEEELARVNSQLQEKVAELEHSNDDLGTLLHCSDVCTLFLDSAMRIKRFTPSAARLLNLQPSDIERPLSDFSLGFSGGALLTDADAVVQMLTPAEKEILTNDGRHFLRHIQPYRSHDRGIGGLVITFVDISARVQAEQRLRESEARLAEMNDMLAECAAERTGELARRAEELRTLAANVPAMFSYVDAGERYRYVNRLYERQHRLTADKIHGRSVRELLGEKNYAVAKPHIDKALAGETDRYEATFQFPEGIHTMDVVYVPEKDSEGRVKGFYTLVHDITERKTLERKLRDSEQRVRAIVNAAGDAIITVDHEGIVRDCNPAAERIFRRPAAAVIGRDARLLLPPSCRTCTNYPACFCLGQCPKATQLPQELLGRRQDGTLFPMEVTVSEIEDVALSVAVVRDISERKDLERQIIEVSTAEQERIGRDIHDGIGQQLTALTMLARGIERNLVASGRPAEAKEVRGLVDHLQDTLSEARSLANGLSPVSIDPEGLVDAISGLTERACKSSTTVCRFTADPGIEISGENLAVHLYRIAQEALHNALRHAQPRKIEVRLAQEGPDLVLSIYDDGAGFPPTTEQRAGLGLHIMRYRAGILGGQLAIDCPTEGGTLVTCRCPATGGVPRALAGSASGEGPATGDH